MRLTKPMNFPELLSAGEVRFDVELENQPHAAGALFMAPAQALHPGPLLVPLDFQTRCRIVLGKYPTHLKCNVCPGRGARLVLA